MGFVLEFAIIAGAAVLGWRVARWINLRTGMRPLGALVFALIFVLPWVDMIPGYFILRQWAKTHPPNAIYARQGVPGVLLERTGQSLLDNYLFAKPAYAFVELQRSEAGVLTGYARYFLADPDDTRCFRAPPPHSGRCIAKVIVQTPQSAFAWEPLQPPIADTDSTVFLIRRHQQRVREIASGRVIAEAWRGIYVPWLVRLGGFGQTIQSPDSSDFHPFRLEDVLIPQS
jgi:hypothetical protein